jgi:hypothetical protein
MASTEENWDFYQCNVNDKPASIYVNLALKENAPNRGKPNLLIVWLYLQSPSLDHGMTTQEESKILFEIEDALVASVEKEFLATYAGRITNDRRREFYFYGHTTDGFEQLIKATLGSYPNYKFEAWFDDDADWSHYLNLMYPTANNLRWMSDCKVVAQLESHGDDLLQARPIKHWAYFPSVEARDQFSVVVVELGFVIQDYPETDNTQLPCGISFEKSQAAQLNGVFQTTSILEQKVTQFGGSYDGWESPVMSNSIKRPWWKFWK